MLNKISKKLCYFLSFFKQRLKIKYSLRKIFYIQSIQGFITWTLLFYIYLVYFTSRKRFANIEIALSEIKNNQPLIILFWHNRLMMIPFFAKKVKKYYPKYQFMTLASKHGDGRFVGLLMKKLGFISILGSTRNNRNPSRGIGFDAIKQIFAGLKKGYSIGITPDGPRGPNQKINGDVVNIARMSGAKIITISCSFSRFKEINSWDKFKIALPFSRICYYCNDKVITVDKKANKLDMEKIKLEIEKDLDLAQEKSMQMSFF